MASRKTAQQKQDRFDAAMNEFKRGVAHLETTEDAAAFVKAGLRRGGPARNWYANFEAYLMYRHIKSAHWANASHWEQRLYAGFDQRRRMKRTPQ